MPNRNPSSSRIAPPLGGFATDIERLRTRVETHLNRWLPPATKEAKRLHAAMRYSALAPGKRIRPLLVYAGGKALGAKPEHLDGPACAVELIHAYSLVHDDLPAMDDDDLRRGQPTSHKKFGEAMAILAGDALLTLSFEVVAREISDPSRAGAILLELARRTGWSGMIGGQAADVLGESQPPSRALTEYIHRRKTASLFEAACRTGAIAAGADSDAVEQAGSYGWHLGSAFQITDDLLDVTASSEQMGKGVAKDAQAGKQTMAAAVGSDASKTIADAAIAQAVEVLEPLGSAADDLRALAGFVVERHH